MDEMRWAARILRDFQDRSGVRIYVTWPAVAGDGCYRTDNLHREARQLFAENGIEIVGDVADSIFDATHMLDTYYHVDSTAAEIRTKRLIDRLSKTAAFAVRSDTAFRSAIDQGSAAFHALSGHDPR